MNSLLKLNKINKLNYFKYGLNTFSGAKRGEFFQTDPMITNQYVEDPFMREQLAIEIPKEFLNEIEQDLHQFGHKVSTNIQELHLSAEKNPPILEQFDSWSNRIDKLITCDAWKQMKNISASEGLIAIPYEKKYSIYSRIYQIVKLYLFAPSSALYTCPLAMTDGAAKTIQLAGTPSFTKDAFSRLTSRDPTKFWTSGQWMTERRGGSDVANGTETIAIAESDSDIAYKLYGYKFFSSATDSDMTITLAKTYGTDSKISKDLTMFFAKVRNDNGSLNGIEIQKLKNKLGTRQLPTAELLLDGTYAYKMSELGNGISKMSSMLNITRIHNSMWAVSNMRRVINFARDYATKRKAFGKFIINHDLHCQTLSNMEVECRASFLTLIFAAKLLGKIECNQASNEEQELLRFITPLLKLYTAKQSIAVASEGLEAFGGQGYIEDTGFPNFLRDAQVLSIWEGTTNILSLDVLRSIKKSNGESLNMLSKHISIICEESKKNNLLKPIAEKIEILTKQVAKYIFSYPNTLQTGAREYSYSLYRLLTASLILERCIKTKVKETDFHLLKKWCINDLAPIITYNCNGLYDEFSKKNNIDLFMQGHPSTDSK